MQCKVFVGWYADIQAAFNDWAREKRLTKDMLIHTHQYMGRNEQDEPRLMIIVFYADDKIVVGHSHTNIPELPATCARTEPIPVGRLPA